METLVYKSPYLEIKFNKEKSLFLVKRLEASVRQSEEEYKNDALKWLENIKKFKPTKILVDQRQMGFIIYPELQQWVNKNLILPAIETSIRKIAFIKSKDFFTHVSMTQTMEEASNIKAEFAYFDNEKDALEWLLK